MISNEIIPGGLTVAEGDKVNHRFYGPAVVTNVRNAYQGMVEIKTQDGTVKPALTGDLTR